MRKIIIIALLLISKISYSQFLNTPVSDFRLHAKLRGGNTFRDAQNIVGDTALINIRDNGNTSSSEIRFNRITLQNTSGNGQLTWGNLTNTGLTWQPPNASGTLARVEDFASGQTIGANTTGNAATATNAGQWAGQNYGEAESGQINTYSLALNNQGMWSPTGKTAYQTWLNINDGSILNNVASSALTWGGSQADFSSEGSNLSTILGRNSSGVAKPYSFSQVKTALATSLQDVTTVSGITTNLTQFNGGVRASSNDGNDNTLVRNIDLQAATLQTVPVSSTSQSMTANRVYIPHNSSLTTFTLPATASEGQLFQIVGEGAGGWRVSQNSGQQIVAVNASTTSGTAGYIQSSGSPNCTVTLRCTVANTKFTITSSQGTINSF